MESKFTTRQEYVIKQLIEERIFTEELLIKGDSNITKVISVKTAIKQFLGDVGNARVMSQLRGAIEKVRRFDEFSRYGFVDVTEYLLAMSTAFYARAFHDEQEIKEWATRLFINEQNSYFISRNHTFFLKDIEYRHEVSIWSDEDTETIPLPNFSPEHHDELGKMFTNGFYCFCHYLNAYL